MEEESSEKKQGREFQVWGDDSGKYCPHDLHFFVIRDDVSQRALVKLDESMYLLFLSEALWIESGADNSLAVMLLNEGI